MSGGGGQTTSTVYQETSLQRAQAAVLRALSPYLLEYGQTTIPQLQDLTTEQIGSMLKVLRTVDPTIGANLQNVQGQGMLDLVNIMGPQLLQQIQGQPTAQQFSNYANVQNIMRSNAATMGIGPGDPRLMQGIRAGAEGLTKPSSDTMGMLMQLFGGGTGGLSTGMAASQANMPNAMNPSALLAMMGQGGPSGSTTRAPGEDQTMGWAGMGVSTAALAAMIYLMS